MLVLPDIRQRSGWDCGHAAVQCVCEYLGAGPLPEPWPGVPSDGTDPRTIESVLWNAGLAVQAGEMTIEDLRHHTECAGRPVIVLMTYQGEGHYQVVRGVRNKRVYYHCPVAGPKSDHEKTFLRRWSDIDRWGVKWFRFAIAVGSRGG